MNGVLSRAPGCGGCGVLGYVRCLCRSVGGVYVYEFNSGGHTFSSSVAVDTHSTSICVRSAAVSCSMRSRVLRCLFFSSSSASSVQGLTLVHVSAQLKRFLWDQGCVQGMFERGLEGMRGGLGCILCQKRLKLS